MEVLGKIQKNGIIGYLEQGIDLYDKIIIYYEL